MFNPMRLALARKRRGMNKIRLAESVGLTSRSISAFENGEKVPAEDTIQRISSALLFPVDFFFGNDLDVPSSETASFRSMARMTAAKRDAALGAGALAFLLNDWIEERFELPKAALIDLRAEAPETAAVALRQHWGLGERPVKNMVHLLEAMGVRVFSLEERSVEVDAFSLWRNETPFVFLNTLKSAEHSRFDAAHELGHLVLHKHGGPKGQDTEQEANAFASAFLMPKASVLGLVPQIPTLQHIIQLKRNWIVSVAALAYRLKALGLLSEWHYRSLCMDMSEKGYRTTEPEPAQKEISQLLAKIFLALRQDGISKHELANTLQIHVSDLEKLVFGLTFVSLDGSETLPKKSSEQQDGNRSYLRVVK